jgi:putative ABC transport system substrate-binding protein
MSAINRRTFPALLGAAVLSRPLAARAQQSAMPIGYLDSQSPGAFTDLVLPAIRQGLKETGYVEGETLAIVYRWAETQIDRLPALAAELVGRRVAVVVTGGGPPAAVAAKGATKTIPVVFGVGDDRSNLALSPVSRGLAAT